MIRELSASEEDDLFESRGESMASQVRRDVRAFVRGGARACELVIDGANPRSLEMAARGVIRRGGYDLQVSRRGGRVFIARREER